MTRPLTAADAEALERIKAIDASDPEVAHMRADEALLESAHPFVREAYDALVEACAWWGSA